MQARLYNRRVALLGAAFSALAVLQIQQSHFFTVDTVANFFIFLAIYFAVEIMLYPEPVIPNAQPGIEVPDGGNSNSVWRSAERALSFLRQRLSLYSVGFGLSLGLAVASKLSAAPLAILLPGAFIVRYLTTRPQASIEGEQQPSVIRQLFTIPWLLITSLLNSRRSRIFRCVSHIPTIRF